MFEANGYDVLRGAGSKGEVFGMKADLVCTKRNRTAVLVIVQCKLNNAKPAHHSGQDATRRTRTPRTS
jgi:hypothetical protein